MSKSMVIQESPLGVFKANPYFGLSFPEVSEFIGRIAQIRFQNADVIPQYEKVAHVVDHILNPPFECQENAGTNHIYRVYSHKPL